MNYRKLNKSTRKYHSPLPFVDQMLDRLEKKKFYYFLDSYSGYKQIVIDLEDPKKTTLLEKYNIVEVGIWTPD